MTAEVVGRWPYQQFELRGAVGWLYKQLITGESIGREVLVEGRAGTGKTTGILSYLVQAGWTWPGSRILVCRETRTSLNESVLVTLETEVLGADHPAVLGGPERKNRTHYDIGESQIVLGGLDTPERLFSTRWDIVYMAEAIECARDSWELFGRAQRPGGRRAAPFRQRIADVNPGPPMHWLNTNAEPCPDSIRRIASREDYSRLAAYHRNQLGKKGLRRLVSVHQDNPGYWDWDAWAWTEDGLDMIAGLESMTGHRRNRMLEGRWVSAEGSVFPEFDEERHVIRPFPTGWPKDWPVWIGYDPGYAHPCAVVFMGIAPNGQPHIVDEIHGSEIDLDRLAPMIRAKAAKYRVVKWLDDPRGANQRRQESNGQTVRDIMRDKHRLFFQGWQAAEGAGKQSQVEAVRLLLIDPVRPLQVWDTCPGVIGEFQAWAYARMADGRLKAGDDAYEDRDNDAMDAVMGIVAEKPRFEQQSIRVMGRRPTYEEEEETFGPEVRRDDPWKYPGSR